MQSSIKTSIIVLALSYLSSLAAGAQEYPLVDAVECRPRAGLPNVFARLNAGEEVRVAYIGGSITAANGWRPKTTAWLQKEYPKAKIVEINAAIGGTGSDLGVFRFRQDVLDHKPHLIFIEFAVNDGGAAPDQIHRCMEGMVRQAWKQDPAIDICFVYTIVDGWVSTLEDGKFPRAASAMEKIAERYQIPSIHMAMEVAKLHKEGKLILRADPKTDQERSALKDKMVFSADGVHPHAETGHQLYLEAVARSFNAMKPMGTAGPHKLPEPAMSDNFENAKLIPIEKVKAEGFVKLDPQKDALARNFRRFLPQLYKAEPGQAISFRFKGTLVGFVDLLGPDCGLLRVTIDEGKPATVARIDAYCTYHRIGSFIPGRGLTDGVHTVVVTVDPADIDKAGILAKNGNKIDDPKRFAGKSWYVSGIMILGDMAD